MKIRMVRETEMRLGEEEEYLRDGYRINAERLREKFEESSKRLDEDIGVYRAMIASKEAALDQLKVQRADRQPAEVSVTFMVSE